MSSLPSKCPPLGITARATINRVIDGDTIVLEVRDTIIHVRLLDCWAPETSTPEGQDAKRVMETLAPVGASCTLHIPTGMAANFAAVFTFSRILAGVWMEGDEDSLSHHMVQLRHATREKA